MTWFEAASKSGVCSRAPRIPGLAVLASVLVLLFGSRPASAQAPADNPHGKLDLPCATCHSSDGWTPAKIDRSFNHSSFGFVLADGHGAVACRTCHTSLEFSKVATTCASCHKDVHQGELGLDCAQCHNTRAFGDRATQVQSHALTRFPLDGAHRTVDCASCHTTRNGSGSLVFRGAPTDCVACHRDTFERTTNPSHPAAGFPTDCTSCHTNVSWQTATFDHNLTKFALTGAHQAVRCESCHQNGVYQSLSTDCVACHQPNFDQTSTPPHAAAHFPTECATCHTTTTWQGAPFDHNTTQFPLDGAHQAVTCQECHGDGQYVGKPTACLSCHQASFDQTKTPPHHDAGFPTDCTSCHTTSAWAGAAFDHNTTKFPLSGAHQAARCQDCHVDGVYVGKATTCVSCHQSDYNATTTPNHQATGFPTECTTCHTTVTWTGARFDHNTTHFPLTGGHAAVACASCHGDGVFAGKPTTCVACHQDNYGRTTNPPHQASGFPTDCATCHTTTNWVGAPFDHNKTQFPLTGAHQAATCQNCHADGVYAGRPTTCVSCHQPNYDRTSNPVHRTAGFSTNCSSCHNVNTWAGAVFDHNQTQFPLTGAHLAATCQTCHADGIYDGKPTTCVSCHQARFDGTRDPDHRAAQFPSDCSLCHTTAAWEPSPFNHSATQFPLTGPTRRPPARRAMATGVPRQADGVRGLPLSRTTTGPRIPSTARPDSRRTAPRATTPMPGPVRSSTTGTPGSRWPEPMPRPPVRRVTATASTPASRRPACRATRPASTAPRTRTTGRPSSRPDCVPLLAGGLAAVAVQSRHDGLPADRRPRGGHLSVVPRGRRLRRQADDLRVVPPDRLQRHHRPEPPGGPVLDNLHHVPHDGHVDRRHLQPWHDPVPAPGRACRGHLPGLPRRRRLRRQADDLRLVPPGRLQRRHQPEPPDGPIPDDLRGLPHRERLEARDVQPRQHRFPADRRARGGHLSGLPWRRGLRRETDDLCLVPPDRVRRHHDAEARERRLLDDLFHLPHDDPVGLSWPRPRQYPLPAHRGPLRGGPCTTATATGPAGKPITCVSRHQTDCATAW
ncbi:MAG: hypothetical protein R2882_09275 [Gemmatimonadales bacterium]